MTDSPDIQFMDLKEFLKQGFLQEANRQFFHPHGLALAADLNEETGEITLYGIWDYREDSEGIYFGPNEISQAKVDRVADERKRHDAARRELFNGSVIQSG